MFVTSGFLDSPLNPCQDETNLLIFFRYFKERTPIKRSLLRNLIRLGLTLIAGIVAGFLLLLAVYALPVEPMEANVLASVPASMANGAKKNPNPIDCWLFAAVSHSAFNLPCRYDCGAFSSEALF